MAGDAEMQMSMTAVHRHAAAVDDAADRIATARSAAVQVQMGTQAYGQICAFLPSLIDSVGDRAVTALDEAATALRETATSLRTVAAATESTDHGNARRIGASGRLELPL